MKTRRILASAVFLAASTLLSTPVSAVKSVLPFIEDDYPAAVSQARAKKLPIFIEAWAPW
jgi:hypothetical protein